LIQFPEKNSTNFYKIALEMKDNYIYLCVLLTRTKIVGFIFIIYNQQDYRLLKSQCYWVYYNLKLYHYCSAQRFGKFT